ncbi:MAG: hypothetical protein RIQ93_3322 [Verrucomicrobiota bacterium]
MLTSGGRRGPGNGARPGRDCEGFGPRYRPAVWAGIPKTRISDFSSYAILRATRPITNKKALREEGLKWSGRRDSNSRRPPWQGGALPTELRPRNRVQGVGVVARPSTAILAWFPHHFSSARSCCPRTNHGRGTTPALSKCAEPSSPHRKRTSATNCGSASCRTSSRTGSLKP